MNKAVVALGSNIDPEYHTPAAIDALSEHFSMIRQSEFVYTKPLGYEDQDDFLNGAVLVETPNQTGEIETVLKEIEHDLGRERTANINGPRKIDLDLVLMNGSVIDEDVYERSFLQDAITEVLPNFKSAKFDQ